MDISYKLILIPLIAMSIGWFTNYVAIKLLFHPRNEINFLGLKLHGVFPKRQKEIAIKLGELFSEQLNIQAKLEGTIENLLSDQNTFQNLKMKLSEIGQNFINEELPLLQAFVTPQIFDSLSTRFSTELVTYLNSKFGKGGETEISKRINVKNIVAAEIEALNSSELEELLNKLLKKEFKFIEYSGAVLGLFIGFIQVTISLYL